MSAFTTGAVALSNFVEFAWERYVKKEKKPFDFNLMERKESMRTLFLDFARWLTTERKLFKINKIKERNYEMHATLSDVQKEMGSSTLAIASIEMILRGLRFAVHSRCFAKRSRQI